MRPVIFTGLAHGEMIEAQDWFENEARGLGRRFRAAVDGLITQMSANPRQFPVVYKDVRRALVRRFPYALMYVIEPSEAVTVIACFHGSRDPTRWQRRERAVAWP